MTEEEFGCSGVPLLREHPNTSYNWKYSGVRVFPFWHYIIGTSRFLKYKCQKGNRGNTPSFFLEIVTDVCETTHTPVLGGVEFDFDIEINEF